TADGHPEHGPGDATLGVADLGVLGEVAAEAHAGLGHGASLLNAWPGGLLCPWTRGTVDTVACHQATRGKRQSQRSRPCIKASGRSRLTRGVVWWCVCAWGWAMPATVRPDPSTLGAVGERGSDRESCSQLGSGSPVSC